MAGLILKRHEQEEICIGDSIRVKVFEIGADFVRLNIVAPPDVVVDRLEVYAAKLRDGRKADEKRLLPPGTPSTLRCPTCDGDTFTSRGYLTCGRCRLCFAIPEPETAAQ